MEAIKKKLENFKNYQTQLILKKDFYINVTINDNCFQGFIKDIKSNNKYDIIYSDLSDKLVFKNNLTIKEISFLGSNYTSNNNNIRENYLNPKFNHIEKDTDLNLLILDKLGELYIDLNIINNEIDGFNIDEQKYIIENISELLKDNPGKIIKDEKGEEYNITGYYTTQFFSGIFIDVIIYINNKLSSLLKESIQNKVEYIISEDFKKIIHLSLNLIIFVLSTTIKNIKQFKEIMQLNRRIIIIDKISSILSSVEIILSNILLIFCFRFEGYQDIEKKLVMISKICYDIIMNNYNDIPIQFFIALINFITYEDNIIRIENFDKNKVYTAFLQTIQNLNEADIKYIKNFSDISSSCINIVKKLYKKEINVLINSCYYNFLINSLTKSNILDKKISALNCINDIIINMFEKENEINLIFYEFFYNKHKILNIFFEETVHNEILRRSIELFKYLSTYDKLESDLITKLIKLDNNCNTIVRNILCEIIKSIRNVEEKTDLFMKITKDFNFDNNNNQNNIIDFVTKLTLACFYSQENKPDLDNDITNGYSSIEDAFNNDNVNNDHNISFSKKSNIQIVKFSGILKNNSSYRNNKLSRNVSNRSIERINNDDRNQSYKNNYNKRVNAKRKYFYGLDMFFKYILYNYDVKKALETNNLNISKAIKAFKYILESINVLKTNDIYHFLKELLDNIQTNKKHNSVVQSLILIEILLNKLQKGSNDKNDNAGTNNKISSISNLNNEENEVVHQLDDKFDIITLIIDDLIRYVKDVNESPNKKNKDNGDYKESIFEGIYSYMDNISIRLKLLFIFVYCDIVIKEEHIKKLYDLFKEDTYKEERILLFKEISNNIYSLKSGTLQKIFTDIFQNNDEFDRAHFEEEETFLLIKDLFVAINLYKHSLLDDSKAIKVNAVFDKMQGFDFLFDILIKNRNPLIIKRLCRMLSHYCFYLTTYRKDFPSKYWTSFINKIISLMQTCNKEKNIEGIYALGKLTESIYNFNFSWRIPGKEDVHEIGESYNIYQFSCPDKGNKSYKLKVGKNDKFYLMRWKLAYYFDLYVNDVVVCDLDNNKYNLLYDDNKFSDLFPPRKYQKVNLQLEYIKVYEQPNQLLLIPNNPSELIEKNEKIINILIDNLKEENNDEIIKIDNLLQIKREIWNILEKLPKQKYIELLINKFDIENNLQGDDIKEIINFDEIFVLTYNLQCFISYLCDDTEYDSKEEEEEKNKQKNIFLNIFTNAYHIDKILYSDFTTKDVDDYLKDEDMQFIYYEYTKYLLIITQIIEEYKMKKNILFMSISNKNEKLRQKNTINSKNDHDLNSTKLSSMSDLKGSVLNIIGYKPLFDKLTDIIILILNDTSKENDSICCQIVQEIINLVNSFKNINSGINYNYFEFIFDADILFKKIFIYDFIRSQKNEVKNLLSDFLLKNLFERNSHSANLRYNLKEDKEMENKKIDDNKNIKKFFDIILSPEIFSFMVNNQKDGSYFKLISSMIEKYINNKKKIINIQNTQKDIKKIIDLIIDCLNNKDNIYKEKNLGLLNYPYSESSENKPSNEKDDKNKNDFINGILLYLLRILELSEDCHPIIDYFLNSIDVCNFFLIKGILNKCNHNPLFSQDNPYSSFNSHKNIYQILIFILKYLNNNNKNILEEKKYLDDSLYMKIWNILNRYHKLEFWSKSQDFEMNFNNREKQEFIGLRNMSSTCYMNSILQQFFMIPMLRETILTINTEKQDSILYQLQLTFAALKTYEFKYYDPKYFTTVSKLSFYEQMDADEYYGSLVDKLETDINNISNSKNYQNIFKYFFGIKLTDELFFVECNHKRYNESLSYNIQLEVKNYNNINDSLKNYFKTEIMSGDNKIICEECKTKRVCHKKLKLKTLPNILVISLKRFDYNYSNMSKFKLNNYFEFPFELNMSEFLINKNESSEKGDNKNSLYDLKGITIHYGVSDYGHYYDLIKAVNNKWYKFNDTNITEFSETDIPKEAFGDKESENNDLEEEIIDKAEIKEKENKNAYILIYIKKNFNSDNIRNSMKENNEYNIKLVYPPYNKMSNITPNMKSYINYKMFKYWTLENISDANYQNFILELLKLDLVKNINKEINGIHFTLIDNLKSGGYLPIKNYINTGITIFSFGLLYCCNILTRSPKEKNILKLFEEILIVYLENDPKKCIYTLEEFSNFEIIDEFIFSCNKDEVKKDIIELISSAFNNLYEFVESSEEISNKYVNLLVKYINCIIIFIQKNKTFAINNLPCFDSIANLFYKLVYGKKVYLNYLKKNVIDKWLDDILIKIDIKQNETINTIDNKNNEDSKKEENEENNIINEKHFPILESTHCILKEKTEEFDFGIKFNKNIEITGFKSKIYSKKNYDGIAFIKTLLEDLKEITIE